MDRQRKGVPFKCFKLLLKFPLNIKLTLELTPRTAHNYLKWQIGSKVKTVLKEGTEIIPFGPFKAVKIGFKDLNLHFKIMTKSPIF